MCDTEKPIVFAEHLRLIAKQARVEGAAVVVAKAKGKIVPYGIDRELQELIDNFPQIATEAIGRGRWGITKKFKSYGVLVHQQKEAIKESATIIKEFESLTKYCHKHGLGLFIRAVNLRDLEITIAWEKPIGDGWAYRAKPEDWLIPYSTE